MSEPPICKVCGQPLDQHELVTRWGVAHAGWRDLGGRLTACSEAVADYNQISGRIDALTTIVRSLRWHAGRLRTKGATWDADDLDTQSNKFSRDIDRLLRNTQEYYAWTKE